MHYFIDKAKFGYMWTKMNERMLMEFVYKLEPNIGTHLLYWSQVLLLAHAYLLSSLNSPEHSLVAPLISGSRDYISFDYIQVNIFFLHISHC